MKTKQFISAILAFSMVFGMGTILPKQAGFQPSALTASAADYTEGTYGDLTYKKYDTYVEISKCDKNAETVEIPAEIDGLPVTIIGGGAFDGCTSLTSVTIPDSVTSIERDAFYGCTSLTSINVSKQNPDYTSIDGILYDKEVTTLICCPAGKSSITIPDSVTTIGSSAFSGCTSLTSVTIPDSVTEIGYYAFYGCTSLTSVTIPDSVTTIGWYAFYGCTSLTSVTIPDSVTTIGEGVFRECTSLTSVTIPDSVTTIGSSAFYGCTSLTSVTIPDSVTTIEDYAFSGCTSLESVTIPDSVTTIEWRAFSGCTSLTSVNIPDSVTSIGDFAFYGCTSLTSVNIPDSVTSIGDFAFYGCTSLTSVNIPDSVTTIGGWAFSDCTSLTSINVSEQNPNYTSIDGILYDKEGTTLICCPAGKTSVTIPDSVTTIEWGAFYGCTSLTSVTIPDSVTTIEWHAFDGCTSLTSVTIPDSVTTIGNDAFSGCTSLTSVTIPDSVTKIEWHAFDGCTSLTSINVSKQNPNYTSIDGILYNKKGTTLICCPAGKTSVTIPDSVTTIRDAAFYGCTSLTSVTIPDSVTTISNAAFYGCTNLKDVYYTGTKEQWNAITIGGWNNPLINATIHYNSTAPETPAEKLEISVSSLIELNQKLKTKAGAPKKYDLNGDGIVNIIDLALLKQKLLNQ